MISNLIGITDNRISAVAAEIIKKSKRQALILTTSGQRARRIAEALSFFAFLPVYVLPEETSEGFKFIAKGGECSAERQKALNALVRGEDCFVVAPIMSALKLLPSVEKYKEKIIRLDSEGQMDRADLIEKLVSAGYERMQPAEAPGQFSVRGDIIDIFPVGEDLPVRIELFDTDVDSLRLYDPVSQRSVKTIEKAVIYPSGRDSEEICENHLWDYAQNLAFAMVDDPSRISEYLSEYEIGEGYSRFSDINKIADFADLYFCTAFSQKIEIGATVNNAVEIETRQAPSFGGHMDMLATELKNYKNKGYKIVIACSSAERLTNLRDFMAGLGLENKVELRQGVLSSGMEYVREKLLCISDSEIFPYTKKARKKRKAKGQEIKVFTDIKQGDYVVHEAHGVGCFKGVEKKTILGSTKDYLRIEYGGGDVLYVPVDQMGSLQKYVGSDGAVPRINKLSGNDWAKTKERVKAAVKDMAEDFLKKAAERQAAKGYEYGPDSTWQKEFEESFPYQETEDQLRCSEEIKQDMRQGKCMDRLLCGDVGYGKTEVAARGIFKCLEAGKQCAILVPTTVLCNQHYHTLKNRFAGYPFNIDMLCRFKTAKEQEKIIERIKTGDIDLVIGTHRLLSKDVQFKDLGMLIIDEEQRFGVEHKEKIKELKNNVDVLTLTATPIPRTLHMSLTGIRDMSVIEEPPEDRYPVQTYVLEDDDETVAKAINRELKRGGQVFIVYNRVKSIESAARRIRQLVPDAKVAVGHGQMNPDALEDVMLDFVEGKTNVLVASTIIESGLDIPNVNTIIIMDADRLGLSQLYQLRGRVGRSNRIAYAYLVYKKDKALSELAEKRLKAIKEFTEFGSGFRVAMRDLEIRGAGNILGVEQSGHMLSVGYELYCKLVDEAVRELQGIEEPVGPLSDTAVELALAAYLPERYIEDEMTRLDMYKHIAVVASEEDVREVTDELIDRFGDLPREAVNLLNISLIHNMGSLLGVDKVILQQDSLIFSFGEQNTLKPEIIGALLDRYGLRLTIYGGVKPRFAVVLKEKSPGDEALAILKLMQYN